MLKRIAVGIFALFFVFSFVGVANAAVTWEETQPEGGADTSWTPSAISSDGQKIIVGNQAATMYISSDGGSSWELIDPTGGLQSVQWLTTSMSSDGQIILAGNYGGRLYRSIDGGDNWSEIRPAGDANLDWSSTSMSSDGQIMLAGIRNSGRLYLSNNGGEGWSEIRPAGDTDQSWGTSDMSSDGQIMVAGVINGRLYLSINAGSNWTEITPAGDGDEQWYSVGMSSGGQAILVGNANSLFLSTNTGGDWIEVLPAGEADKSWHISSVSSDGETFFAGGGDRLYISIDGGDSWSQTQPAGDEDLSWNLGNMSSDSQILLAGVYNGRLYLGSNPLPDPAPRYGSSSSGTSTTSAPNCSNSPPSNTPDLFQIDATNSRATLYFAPAANSEKYFISYGDGSTTGQYGVEFPSPYSDGVIKYTVNSLSPGASYSFTVRGGNGCMPGDWSNTMTIKTTSSVASAMSYYKNFLAKALSLVKTP